MKQTIFKSSDILVIQCINGNWLNEKGVYFTAVDLDDNYYHVANWHPEDVTNCCQFGGQMRWVLTGTKFKKEDCVLKHDSLKRN